MIPETAGLRNPYPGLRSFEAEDAEYFFGRDHQVDELLLRLRDHRFVAVLGQSGSGKSSLVRAGLVPALKAGHLTSSGRRWRVALFRPGSQPLEALADALDKALEPLPDRLASLRTSTNALLLNTRAGRRPEENLLMVADQFEEVFRVSNTRDVAHFVDLLLAVEQDISPLFRVYVVLTMRTDRLGECARFESLPEALNRSQYLVPKLASAQLREAIEGPAALTDTAISPELIQKLTIEASEGRDQLPLLQHLLMTLWERRQTRDGSSLVSLAEYETARSAADALNDHADRVLDELPEDRRELASLIFRALTDASESRDQRHPQRLSELAKVTGAEPEEVRAIAEHFYTASFLTSPDRGRTPDWEVDITHESLIRQWKKLAEWVKEELDDADDYRYYLSRAHRHAGPLTGLELLEALDWLEKNHNAFWAVRYGGDFDATTGYILKSQWARDAQSSLGVRKAVGIIGLALPFLLTLGKVLFQGPGIQDSISSYYYTDMRNVFMASLCAIGVLLVSYGYERREKMAARSAGIYALGMACFPTVPAVGATPGDKLVGVVHLFSLVLFFLTSAYFSLMLFTQTDPSKAPTRQKLQRNVVYRVSGYIMLACIVLIFVASLPSIRPLVERLSPRFWLESVAFQAFGVSWLTKGVGILMDQETPSAAQQTLADGTK